MASPGNRVLGVGMALCGVLACGRAQELGKEPLELFTSPIPRPDPDGLAVDPEGSTPGLDADGPGPLEPAGTIPDLPDDPRQADVLALIDRECSGCHAPPNLAGDMFADLEALIGLGLEPGAAEVSPLVLWFQYGSSRREHAGLSASPEEFEALVGYVNGLPVLADCLGLFTLDRDQAYELMALDIATRSPADRPFIRYVSSALTNTPDGCEEHRDGKAFRAMLNAVSLGPVAIFPEGPATDPDQAVHVLDIRDYGWNAPIEVAGQRYLDHWSAIVAAVPDAPALSGPDVDLLEQETQSPMPFLTAGQFVTAAAVGPLYSALVGIGDDVSARATSLGVDAGGSPWRAGLFGSGALPDRAVTRREQQAFPGRSWWTREELPMAPGGASPLAQDPVRYADEGAEVIFTLPNGFLAFAIGGSDGRSVDQIPRCIGGVPCPTVNRAENSVTCRACHGSGLVSVTDEVLTFVDSEPNRYPPDLERLIREQYRPDIYEPLQADNATSDAAMSAGAGEPWFGRSIPKLYFQRTRHAIDARRAANDLEVSVDGLREAIEALGSRAPELAPLLSGGTVERRQLTAQVEPLLCNVRGLRNVPEACESSP